jgi:hypothetical protein
VNATLKKSTLAYTCLDTDAEMIKNEFDALLGQVYSNHIERRDFEESNIVS